MFTFLFLSRKNPYILSIFQEQYNHVSSPAVSKRMLFFAAIRLLKVLKYQACLNELNFPDSNGMTEYVTHLNNVIESLQSFQSKLKAAVLQEKNDKDELNRDANNERYNRYYILLFCIICNYCFYRIIDGIKEYASNDARLHWHSEVDHFYLKLKDDPDYIPPLSIITESAKFGPIEITLNTPYRAGK